MKISIITVTYNSAQTLQDTINSISFQDYCDIEYIIIDGKSKDETIEIIKNNSDIVTRWISEPDQGLYHAMNKGIEMAKGDIVGIINSDDFYHRNDSISQIVRAFEKFNVECVFSDLLFVHPSNLEKPVRYYSSAKFSPSKFKQGFMPAHPTFFTYRTNFLKYGLYKTNYKIAADFELLIRFLYKHKLKYYYLPLDLLKMRTGGLSTKTWKSNIIINQEFLRACKENNIYTNYFILLSRYLYKIFEFKIYYYEKNNIIRTK